MNRWVLTLAFLLSVGLAMGTGHQAAGQILGRNTDTSTTVFLDNGFESDTVGANPSHATTGSWTVSGTGSLVTSDVSPGPLAGNNYLKMSRPDLGNQPYVRSVFSAPVSGGDTLEFNFALYHSGTYPGIVFHSGASEVARIQGDDGGNYRIITEALGGGGTWENSGLASTLNVWQAVTMTWDTDGSLFRLTVDGNSYDYAGSKSAANVDRVLFRTDDKGAVFYVDAVPEPSALVALGTGLMGLTGFAVRRRR